MKGIKIIFIVLAFPLSSFAQLYDAKWVTSAFPINVIDVSETNVTLDTISPTKILMVGLTIADICDENGNLLFMSNGTVISGKNSDTLLNGFGINPCQYTTDNICCGLNIIQAALFLPMPDNKKYYYLFHFSNDDTINGGPKTLYYSKIDKDGNNGEGEVIEKNVPLLQSTPLSEGGMTACKHANGRDYWLIISNNLIGRYYKFLVTPTGILGPYFQDIGVNFSLPYDNTSSRFSPDGSKYVTGAYINPILIFDFDRCSGLFSNPIRLFNQSCSAPQSCSGTVSVAISSNNRFVYVANPGNLNQYDLSTSNGQDSIRIFTGDSSQSAQIGEMLLAINGKMYQSTWNGIGGFDFIHVINNPDGKGDSCNFVYGGQPMFSNNNTSLPNMINYRLGPLVGSGCDTITDISQQPAASSQMRLQPNPADKYVYVEMSQQGDYELQLLNTLGQTIATQQIKQVANFNTEGLASGVYFIKAAPKSPQGTFNTIVKKLIITH